MRLLVKHTFKRSNGGYVSEQHDEKRYVKGEYTAVEAKTLVEQDARVRARVVHVGRVAETHDEQRRAHAQRNAPHKDDLHERVLFGFVEAVAKREFNLQEAVHRHGAHVVDRGRAAKDVKSYPQSAHGRVERKKAEHLDEHARGHHEQGHHAVGYG